MALPFNLDRGNAREYLKFGSREAVRFVRDVLLRRGSRVERALEYAENHATAGDPESVLAAL